MALDQIGLSQQFQMTRNARLRLAQDFCEVGDSEFGFGEQGKDAQARAFARGLEQRIECVELERSRH